MKSLIYLLIFILSGCAGSCPTVLPEKSELTPAKINKEYRNIIEIKGGAVNKSSVSVNITPSDLGLVWNPEEVKYDFDGEDGINKDYHRIIISGIPKKNQVIIA